MEHIDQTSIPPQQPLTQDNAISPAPANRKSIASFVLMGTMIVIVSVLTGIQIGKQQAVGRQPIAENAPIPPSGTPANKPPSPITSPSNTATSGWKTYTNPTYKYSVGYPDSWKIGIGDNGRTTNFTQDRSPEYISITVHDNPAYTEVHQWLIDRSIVPNPNEITSHIQEENLVVSGINSVKITTPVNGGQYSIYIPKGNTIISIYNNVDPASKSSQEDFDRNITVMQTMVSSLRVLD